MDRGIFEELCFKSTTCLGKMVAPRRVLLQYISSHVYCMPPFRALYGYDALSFVDLVLLDSRVPATSDFCQAKPRHNKVPQG